MFEVGSRVRRDREPGVFIVVARNTNDQGATFYDLQDAQGEIHNNVAESQLLPAAAVDEGEAT